MPCPRCGKSIQGSDQLHPRYLGVCFDCGEALEWKRFYEDLGEFASSMQLGGQVMAEKQKKVWKVSLKVVGGEDENFSLSVVDNSDGTADIVKIALGTRTYEVALRKDEKRVAVAGLLREISSAALQAAVFVDSLKVETKP